MQQRSKNKIYCIVGISNHSVNKLIPSLLRSGKKIVGFVSRSSKKNNPKYKRFSNLDKAIKTLPKKTVFLVCTPPDTHYFYIKKLKKNCRDMIIEKPILTNDRHIKYLKSFYLNNSSNFFIKEAFMYRYSLMFKKTLSFIKSNFMEIKAINCDFIMPSVSKFSFRDEKKIESSCLYDVGCYIFDYFFSLEHSLKNLEILDVNYYEKKIVSLNFSFSLGDIKVNSKIGLGMIYKNVLEITDIYERTTEFNNIFYGRPLLKLIKRNENNEFLYDKNSFIQMFKEDFNMINFKKQKVYYRMKKVSEMLEKIKTKLK